MNPNEIISSICSGSLRAKFLLILLPLLLDYQIKQSFIRLNNHLLFQVYVYFLGLTAVLLFKFS